MSQAARKAGAAELNYPTNSPPLSRVSKTPAFLVTLDDALWPQVGPCLEGECALKQVDSLDELQQSLPAGQACVVLWDVRDSVDRPGDLARLQASASPVIIVLDAAANNAEWNEALLGRRISSVLSVPVRADILRESYARARAAIDPPPSPGAAAPSPIPSARRPAWPLAVAASALALALGAFYVWHRDSPPTAQSANVPPKPSAQAPAAGSPALATTRASSASVGAPNGSAEPSGAPAGATASSPSAERNADEQVESLLDKARQAMLDRHYVDPPEQNALGFYQNALLYDPTNGEARQGLERLAQILFARVQSDLDNRRFDLALQSLETARSILPDDPRLKDLDARIATLRAELGPAQIQAAINAKNFDRARELIDEAGRAKTLSPARIAQLRDEAAGLAASSDVTRLDRLFQARLEQDRLLEPHNDSALFYLQRLGKAGASPDDLRQASDALGKKLMQAVRTSIDQHRFANADVELAAAREAGAGSKLLEPLRRDLAAARESQTRTASQPEQWLETARARIAQGALIAPADDSALYYFGKIKAADAGSSDLPALGTSLLSALVAQGRAAIEANDLSRADALVKAAAGIGGSSELDALAASLAEREAAARPAPGVVPASSLIALSPLQLDYPHEALVNGTEGWVDLTFSVTPDGRVTGIEVVDASPKRVFDAAAKSALARLRYQPVILDGRPTTVKASLHVTFRLASK